MPATRRRGRVARASKAETHDRFLNRELAALDFIERVVARAADDGLALLERVRFLAISSQLVDEFFQVRVAGLQEQVKASVRTTSPDGMTPGEQLQAIRDRVIRLTGKQGDLYATNLLPRLAREGIQIADAPDGSRNGGSFLAAFFRTKIFPVLTPLAVDPGHPFPYISHLSLNLAVVVQDPLRRVQRFARLKVPPLLPRFVAMPDGRKLVPLEQVIARQLQSLFPGMEIVSHHPFRVTRDADLELTNAEADDLLEAVQTELLRQRRHGRAVRLEVAPGMPDDVLQLLVRELELGADDIYLQDGLLDLGGLASVASLPRPDLKEDSWSPTTMARLRGSGGHPPDLFKVFADRDVLVQHPYESFQTSVESFIEQAAADPDVLAIKQTLYRTSGPASPIGRALIRAAESGKQVVALVELKARGDEQANIAWAHAFEEAGVHVVYGLVGLKTHAKLALVVRRELGGIRHYVHVGTGNYNRVTAQVYEDLGMFSTDPELGRDVAELFNFLTGYSRQRRYRKLLVAPSTLKKSVIELINQEAAQKDGSIVIKVNHLVDPEVIDALYGASRAGVPVHLIVRGICCLRPGVPGLSENIRVRSLVGRILEHSRIYRFGSPARGLRYYIGSSDLMPRNLERRVEALAPVPDKALQTRLQEILDASLSDDCLAWQLKPDGGWTPPSRRRGVSAQERLLELARGRERAEHPDGLLPPPRGSRA